MTDNEEKYLPPIRLQKTENQQNMSKFSDKYYIILGFVHIPFYFTSILKKTHKIYLLLIISFSGKHQRLSIINTPFDSNTTPVLKELMARFAQIITLASQAS